MKHINAAYFTIGIVFFVIAISFSPDTPAMAAFIPVGIVFFVIALRSKK